MWCEYSVNVFRLSHSINPTSSNQENAIPESGIPLLALTSIKVALSIFGISPQYFFQVVFPEIVSPDDDVWIISLVLPSAYLASNITFLALFVLMKPCKLWFNKLLKAEDAEQDMIDMAFEPKKNSRLSCQLIVSDELDGLIVTTPSKQI